MDSKDDGGSPGHNNDRNAHEEGQNGDKANDSRHSSRQGSREGSPSRTVAADDPKRSTPKIVVSNMTSNVTVGHLREICSMWGSVDDIRFEENGEKRCAVVTFSKRTEAQDALDHMHRMMLDHQEVLASFTVDEDPRTAVPLSAYGQVSHKEEPGAKNRRRDAAGNGDGSKKDERGNRPRGGRRGRSPRRDRPPRDSYDRRGRSPPRYSDSYRPIRYDDRDRPPHIPGRDRSPRRYDDRYDRRPYDRDYRDYGRHDDHRSGYGRPRSPLPDRHRGREGSPRRYGSPEPKRPYTGDRSPERSGFR